MTVVTRSPDTVSPDDGGRTVRQSPAAMAKAAGDTMKTMAETPAWPCPGPEGPRAPEDEELSEAPPPYEERAPGPAAVMVSSSTMKLAVLPTFQAIFRNPGSARPVRGRALADSGGQTSLITQALADKLKLPRRRSETTLTYAEGNKSKGPLYEALVRMTSPLNSDVETDMKVLIVPAIADALQGFRGDPTKKYPSLLSRDRPLADEYTPDGMVKVDVLVGTDYYWKLGFKADLFEPQEVEGSGLRFQDSDYGLIMSGAVKQAATSKKRGNYVNMIFNHTALKIPQSMPLPKKKDKMNLDEHLRRMVELDTVGIVLPAETNLTAKEEKAVEFLEKNLVFLEKEKRFQVKIPFDETKGPLVNNYHQARNRLDSLMSQLQRDDRKRPMYIEKMKTYLDKNHASVITEADKTAKNIYYLPHSGVLEPKPDGSGWKLRVVFDGSAKDKNGNSPNSLMIQGPVPDVTILRTLVKWREKPVAVSMDVKDCFLMIMLHPEQQNLFRFLWMEPGETEPTIYKFTSLIFGSATSPWISSTCLYKVLDELEAEHPSLVRQVRQNLYVDDLLLSFNTVEEGREAIKVLQTAFESKSFGLAKFKANDDDVLAELTEEQLLFARNSAEDDLTKALGVAWQRRADRLMVAGDYMVNFKVTGKPETKRTLARKVASIYDPLNIVAPWRIGGQLLLSEVWDYHGQLAEETNTAKNCKKYWDTPLPERFQHRINQWAEDYERATEISIRRCYALNLPIRKRTLYGFSDASLWAFGAVVYMVSEYEGGGYESTFICARMKVNLAKPDEAKKATDDKTRKKRGQTMPRAELLGARFLAVLVHNIKNYLDLEEGINDLEAKYFTDSTTALCYMRSEPDRWRVFVANAVRMIHSVSCTDDWYHVPGVENPADLLTRPLPLKDFIEKQDFWLHGPEFLRGGELPVQPDTYKETDEMKAEAKADASAQPIPVILLSNAQPHEHFIRKLMGRYGDTHKAMKYAAILMRWGRWIFNQHHRGSKVLKSFQGPVLSEPEELKKVMDRIACVVQQEEFGPEIQLITKGQPVHKSSKLARLDPVMEDGLLRVRARLDTDQDLGHLPYDWRRPIIIPNKNDLVKRVIMQVHEMTRHAGAALVRSRLRKRWWIISDQRTVRDVVESCHHCRFYSARMMEQKMAPLPASRLAYMEPCFTHVAIDAMGPLKVFDSFRRPKLSRKERKERKQRAKEGGLSEPEPTSKIWILVIGCQTTRAVNLVILDNLSTDAFNGAMQRHAAEHGMPKTVRLDNFRSHLMMAREVDELLEKSFSFDVQAANNRRGIRWSWSAPFAPSTNGVIERLVRTTKDVLRKTIHKENLYYAEMLTFLAEAKHTINSRPLVAQSRSDPAEPDAITPHHLLYGHSLAALPFAHDEGDKVPKPPAERWLLRQRWAKRFNAQFMETYLRDIRQLRKGRCVKDPIRVGDLCLVNNPLEKRREWPLALVTKLITGHDGLTRSCEVFMHGDTFRRAVSSLVKIRHVADETHKPQPRQQEEEGERQPARQEDMPTSDTEEEAQGAEEPSEDMPQQLTEHNQAKECNRRRRSARLAAKSPQQQ